MKDNIFKVDQTGRVGDSAFAHIDTMRSGHGWGNESTHEDAPSKKAHATPKKSECVQPKKAHATNAKAKTHTEKSHASKAHKSQPKGEEFVIVEEIIIVEE